MSFLHSFGAYLPERIVSSEEAASWVGATAEWVLQVSGIEQRRFAADDESVARLAANAGTDCLTRAGIQPSLLIVSSGSSERQFPGPAAETAALMGLAGIPTLDLPVASAGSLHALILAAKLAPTTGPVLVIAAEKMSRLVAAEPKEKGVAILFGDGAGAALVHPEEGFLEILETTWGSDGNFTPALYADQQGPVKMDGRAVIMQAARKIPASIQTVLNARSIGAADVHTFLMHQANQNLIDKVASTLGVPSDRFFSNIRRYGNTSSASMLIAAKEWRDAHPTLAPGLPIVFAAFGAGFHYSAALALTR